MRLLAGEWLWLLLVVAVLGGIYAWLQWRGRATYAVRFTNLALLDVVAPKRPGWRRHVTAAVFVTALAALVVAVAKPARDERVPVERATVVLAIDVSLSMDADDVEPSRLAAARDAAEEFLETVPETLNIGLVRFAGSATVVVPPTTDHDDVENAIEGLDLDEGTAIGEAIFAGLDALDTLPPARGSDDTADDEDEEVPASIVVLSDGETTMGRPNEDGVEAARDADVPVSTIAFGTDDGTISIEGEVVPVPPDLDALEDIADETGGVFFEAESEGELAAAYEDLGSSIGFDTEQQEISEWFVGSGLGLLLVAAAMSLAWFARLP
ncbi:MAG: VWA domain-containing protein [Acidimicrobiales bacterium]